METPRPQTDAGQSHRFAWAALASLIVFGGMAWPFFAGRIYTCDDLGAFHLPLRAFYADCLARGEPFDWAPPLFSGFYLTGEGQAGTYHPWHWLLYRSLPLQTAMGLEVLSSYPFMLAGTYLFLRRNAMRPDAAMLGALIFTFSGFNLLHFMHTNAVAIVAHIPWLLLAIDVLFGDCRGDCPDSRGEPDSIPGNEDPRRAYGTVPSKAVPAIAILTGSQLLLGYPQYVWFSLLVEFGYAAFLTRRRAAAIRAWLQLLVALALGAAIGAVQLLPTFDALAHSQRQTADAMFAAAGSLHPLNLVQLVAPYLFKTRVVGQNTHELGLYFGAVPLMLIAWLVVRRRELGTHRRLTIAAACLGTAALVLAFGRFGLLYGLQSYLPLVGHFRFPARFILIVHLAAAVLSAVAFVLLIGARQRLTPWPRLWPLGAVVAASVLATAACWALCDRAFLAPVPWVLAGPAIVAAAATLVALAARGARTATVGVIVFAAVDLGYYGLSCTVWPHTDELDRFVAAVPRPPGKPGPRLMTDYEALTRPFWTVGDRTILTGWRNAGGYAGLIPARQLDYRRIAALRTAGVGWVKRPEGKPAPSGFLPGQGDWLEVPDPRPRAWLVGSVRPTKDPAAEIDRIDLASTALADESLDLPPGGPGTVAVLEDTPGRMRLATDCPARRLLVVSESYHEGWQAEVDGRRQPVLRANGDFLGCVVEQGRHEVVLAFHPESLGYGAMLSLGGLAATLVWLGIGLARRPRPIEVSA